MRSPPAAIFVWGVHPETTIDDIVNDLAESDIKVDVKDVEKKSKDEAYLVSYKINIHSDDLEKALNPEIWPIRVKVREYIHYKRKPVRAQQGASHLVQGGPGHQTAGRGQYPVQQSLAPSQYSQQYSSVVHAQQGHPEQQGGQAHQQQPLYPNLNNMFSVLAAPGAPNPNL